MTTSASAPTASQSPSNGASPSSLPRWRQFLSTLNWRRDPGYEQRKMQHEWRMKQLKSEIEQIESEIKQIENETEQIAKETEQLRSENARLRIINAKAQRLLSCVDQLCFPPDSSSTHPNPTDPDGGPSSP
jgi:septal ring factor EnvC (AmiA/AmiB activator)